MPTMIEQAALHLHHMDMGMTPGMRSYSYQDAKSLRDGLLTAGFTELEVDGNGKLDLGDYYPEASLRDDQKIQLQNCPEELVEAAAEYIADNPESVLMVAADSLDAVFLEMDDPARVIWVKPDGEMCAMTGDWTQLKAAARTHG